ncbi:hypothetical protein MBLNU230_g4335t1 [Neophaeotheca triangularis]
MNGLRDLLRKKEKLATQDTQNQPPSQHSNQPYSTTQVPEFTFKRTTTESEEVIAPPTYSSDEEGTVSTVTSSPKGNKSKDGSERKSRLSFRRFSNTSSKKDDTPRSREVSPAGRDDPRQLPVRPRGERRLSERLHIGSRNRSSSRASTSSQTTSAHLPQDLPDAPEPTAPGGIEGKEASDHREAQWEKRATILAQGNPLREMQNTLPDSSDPKPANSQSSNRTGSSNPPEEEDTTMQTAIRLHEEGDLEKSTQLFATLASPSGANNALAQVLYGLALRHGWGIATDPPAALHYLSLAASNSASIEAAALQASDGKRGGAAKGELVLAIFELANCFRHGWGVKRDPIAARQYYETAANLGDVDALEEAAWCLLEGFGGAKDKFKAAQYLRLAEQKGSRNVGNSCPVLAAEPAVIKVCKPLVLIAANRFPPALVLTAFSTGWGSVDLAGCSLR